MTYTFVAIDTALLALSSSLGLVSPILEAHINNCTPKDYRRYFLRYPFHRLIVFSTRRTHSLSSPYYLQ